MDCVNSDATLVDVAFDGFGMGGKVELMPSALGQDERDADG